MAFVWDESLALNIADIDEQHQQLISLVNDLEAAEEGGTGGLLISFVLPELVRYIIEHFGEEERLMLLHGFNGLDEHHKEHDLFVSRVKEIKENYRDGDQLSRETLSFLKEWLTSHIKGTDQIYADFIRGKQG